MSWKLKMNPHVFYLVGFPAVPLRLVITLTSLYRERTRAPTSFHTYEEKHFSLLISRGRKRAKMVGA